jgi:uncharacterized protein with FMN-binding domain
MVTPMRRIVLWLMSTVTTLVLLFGYHTSTSSQAAGGGETSVVGPVSSGTAGGSTSSSSSSSSSSAGGSGAAAGSTGASTAGTSTVTGDAASTRWGPVQVQISVADGTITDVSVVEYPDGNGKDRQINARALPVLIRETQDAQSAHIDMVSGATVTSEGYLESLQSALDKAGL